MKGKINLKICLITSPLSDAGVIPTSNLIEILKCKSKDLLFITGNSGSSIYKDDPHVCTISFNYKLGTNVVSKIIKYFHLQLKISYIVFTKAKNSDVHIYFIGSNNLILPIIISKIMGKNVILSLPSSSLLLKFANDKFYKVVRILEIINLTLCDEIILHSHDLIRKWRLEKYTNKIHIAHEYFLDFDKFKIITRIDNRDNLIGYIGRLSREKGVLNFVEAIPEISKYRQNLEYLIIGDGDLHDKIKEYINEKKLNDKVKLMGWIEHNKLPDCLNMLRLLIIPSYTESGPIIALESMACGTPILATRVGHVLELIENDYSGFIMEDNSPESIAMNVEKVLNYPSLSEIAENANELVKREFSYENAVEKYWSVLTNIKK